MKAVVTGASGFIGKAHTKFLLSKDIEVYAIVRNKSKLEDIHDKFLYIIEASFEDYDDLQFILPKNIDMFFHFAWQGVYGEAFKDYSMQLKNVKFACDSLILANKINVKKFIFASTANVLELKGNMDKEIIKPRYTNIYSTSKFSADMILKTLAYNNNINYNCGMISMVYGENNYSSMLPNLVISNLIYNRESNLINPNTEYDMIYIDDVCNAFYHIAIEGINMKTYYVGNESTKKIKDIFDEIREIINPKGIINYGKYNVTNEMDYSKTNMKALYSDTGFEIQSDFKESIIKTAKWIKESGEFK